MLEISERKLTDEEMTALVEEREKIERKLLFHYRFTVISLAFLFLAALLLLYFFLGTASVNLILLALGLIIIYSASVIWGYKQNKRMFIENIGEINETIALNHADVYKCFAESCISFQNKSLDEPAHFFQVDENKLLFISGYDFYGNDKFPNTDFEVIAIKAINGKPLRFELNCKGIRLRPNALLSDQLKKKLRDEKKYPENLSVLPGKLNNLETVLLN